MSSTSTEHMFWHVIHYFENGRMEGPCDGGSWKHFDAYYLDFAPEPCNVRLGLGTDSFTSFGMLCKIILSIRPVMLSDYNLPPWMCMKALYLWLTKLWSPARQIFKKLIYIYMQPLIDDLLTLWNDGVDTYGVTNSKFFHKLSKLTWQYRIFLHLECFLAGQQRKGRDVLIV